MWDVGRGMWMWDVDTGALGQDGNSAVVRTGGGRQAGGSRVALVPEVTEVVP